MKVAKRHAYYDHRFKQWCIEYSTEDGFHGAVWGDSEEECLERLKEVTNEEE